MYHQAELVGVIFVRILIPFILTYHFFSLGFNRFDLFLLFDIHLFHMFSISKYISLTNWILILAPNVCQRVAGQSPPSIRVYIGGVR